MTRNTDETYRSFFNRLVGFVRQHLPKETYTAEGISCPNTRETPTIGLLDAIAIHWLLSIDGRLLDIVKVEYATDLKTKRLCQMVKVISKSVDELLARYEQRDQIASISATSNDIPQEQTAVSPDSISALVSWIERLKQQFSPDSISALVSRIKRLESSRPSYQRKKRA